jgi:hypothetical protein
MFRGILTFEKSLKATKLAFWLSLIPGSVMI